MSDWSKKLLEDSLQKDKKAMLVNLQSPRQEKRLASPRTPEGKISSKIWKQRSKQNDCEVMPELRSKSMNK